MDVLEIIGYCGSVLVAVSLTMKNIVKLRWINLFGAATFSLYGLLLGAYPVFVLNGFITVVDIYYLVQMYKTKEKFSLVPVLNDNHLYLNQFLSFYNDEINKYFPEFNKENLQDVNYYFILRNLVPSGLFAFRKIDESRAEVVLDYATPAFQDFKTSGYIYNVESTFLKEMGIKELISKSTVPKHVNYLNKIGYRPIKEEKNTYAITL